MSKKSRKGKGKPRRAMVPPVSLLRPRLDQLLGDESLLEKNASVIREELDALVADLKPAEVLPVLVRACEEAPEPVGRRLDELVPDWLQQRGWVDVLLALFDRRVRGESRQRALQWMAASGADEDALQKYERVPDDDFYRGYFYTDDSQGLVVALWYTDERRQKIRGMSFLIDYNPPWEGCIKDIVHLPARNPRRAIEQFVDAWTQRGMELTPLEAAETKEKIVKCLEVNRREKIRLPRDLILARQPFVQHILPLPDAPGAPRFSEEDFDYLAGTGDRPEKIIEFERLVGRRVRTINGREVLVMGSPFDED